MYKSFIDTVVESGFTVTIKPRDHLNPKCGFEFIVEGFGYRVVGTDSFPEKEASIADAYKDAVIKFWGLKR